MRCAGDSSSDPLLVLALDEAWFDMEVVLCGKPGMDGVDAGEVGLAQAVDPREGIYAVVRCPGGSEVCGRGEDGRREGSSRWSPRPFVPVLIASSSPSPRHATPRAPQYIQCDSQTSSTPPVLVPSPQTSPSPHSNRPLPPPLSAMPNALTVLKVVAGGTVVLLGAAGGLLYAFQTSLIYPANIPEGRWRAVADEGLAADGWYVHAGSRTNVATPDDYDMSYEDLTLVTPDQVRIRAYLMLQDKPESRPTVLLFHANAGNVVSSPVVEQSVG
jgi:hypothetical protein